MPRVETWGFAAAHADGTGVLVRLTLRPTEGVAWYWAYLMVPDVGLVVVRDHEVPLPRRTAPDLEVRAEALWAELVCETPGEHWGLGLEAFGVVLDDPWDALDGELGRRVPVGLDLEWEHFAPEYRDAGGAREHQFGRVHGELLVGPDRFAFDALGAREHTDSPSDEGVGRHHAAFAVGSERAADVVVEPDGLGARGYVWALGEPLAVTDAVTVESRDAVLGGEPPVPRALRYVVGGGLEVEAETAAFAVVPLPGGYALETLIRVMADDVVGAGFAEWVRARP
jgi:hypothetical protein